MSWYAASVGWDSPVKIRKKSVKVEIVALEGDCILVDGKLVLRHVDDAGAEGLWWRYVSRKIIASRDARTILIFNNASLQSSSRYFALRL